MFNILSFLKGSEEPPPVPPMTHAEDSSSDEDDSDEKDYEIQAADKIAEITADIKRIQAARDSESVRLNAPSLSPWEEKISNMIIIYLEKRLKLYNTILEHEASHDNKELKKLVTKYEKFLQRAFFDKQDSSHIVLIDLELELHGTKAEEVNKRELLELRIKICKIKLAKTMLSSALMFATILENLGATSDRIEAMRKLLPVIISYSTYTVNLQKMLRTKYAIYHTIDLMQKEQDASKKQALAVIINSFISLLILQSVCAYSIAIEVEKLLNEKKIDEYNLQILQRDIAALISDYSKFYQEKHEPNLRRIGLPQPTPIIISEDLYTRLECISGTFGEPMVCQTDIFRYCAIKDTDEACAGDPHSPIKKGVCLRI